MALDHAIVVGNPRRTVGEGRALQTEYVMSNNFAFGGINTSLIFRRWA